MKTEKQKMLAGEPYFPSDPELVAEAARAAAWMARYDASLAMTPEARRALLAEGLGAVGPGCEVRPPFRCDYGVHIRLGANVFINFGCVILDVAPVSIGDRAQIGPGVQILAADHPRDAALRATGVESGRPIAIGEGAWIGGGAILLPGVTVGAGAIVGAGAVVVRDVAPGETVVGNPARPPRPVA